MTINSFASESLAPPLILWSIRDDARSADAFIASNHFILSVLGALLQRNLTLHALTVSPSEQPVDIHVNAQLRNLFAAAVKHGGGSRDKQRAVQPSVHGGALGDPHTILV
jgi:hypothetical protein